MTGKKWTLSQYMTAGSVIFLFMAAVMMLRGFPLIFSLMVSLAAGLGLPHWWVGRLIAKRIAQLNAKFPPSMELLTRRLRSGLPLPEPLGVVPTKSTAPVG